MSQIPQVKVDDGLYDLTLNLKSFNSVITDLNEPNRQLSVAVDVLRQFPRGRLDVTVLRGHMLKDVTLISSMDPYVEISINGVSKKTRIVKDGARNPTFNETITFELQGLPTEQSLVITAYHEATFGKDTVIGMRTLDLFEVIYDEDISQSLLFQIFAKKEVVSAGLIEVTAKFTPDTATPWNGPTFQKLKSVNISNIPVNAMTLQNGSVVLSRPLPLNIPRVHTRDILKIALLLTDSRGTFVISYVPHILTMCLFHTLHVIEAYKLLSTQSSAEIMDSENPIYDYVAFNSSLPAFPNIHTYTYLLETPPTAVQFTVQAVPAGSYSREKNRDIFIAAHQTKVMQQLQKAQEERARREREMAGNGNTITAPNSPVSVAATLYNELSLVPLTVIETPVSVDPQWLAQHRTTPSILVAKGYCGQGVNLYTPDFRLYDPQSKRRRSVSQIRDNNNRNTDAIGETVNTAVGAAVPPPSLLPVANAPSVSVGVGNFDYSQPDAQIPDGSLPSAPGPSVTPAYSPNNTQQGFPSAPVTISPAPTPTHGYSATPSAPTPTPTPTSTHGYPQQHPTPTGTITSTPGPAYSASTTPSPAYSASNIPGPAYGHPAATPTPSQGYPTGTPSPAPGYGAPSSNGYPAAPSSNGYPPYQQPHTPAYNPYQSAPSNAYQTPGSNPYQSIPPPTAIPTSTPTYNPNNPANYPPQGQSYPNYPPNGYNGYNGGPIPPNTMPPGYQGGHHHPPHSHHHKPPPHHHGNPNHPPIAGPGFSIGGPSGERRREPPLGAPGRGGSGYPGNTPQNRPMK